MEPSLASITASILFVMLLIWWFYCLSSNSFPIFSTIPFISSFEVIWRYSRLRTAFIYTQIYSIGFKTGEFGGCWWYVIPSSCLTRIQTFLWKGALSSTTISSSKSPKNSSQKSFNSSHRIWSRCTIELINSPSPQSQKTLGSIFSDLKELQNINLLPL